MMMTEFQNERDQELIRQREEYEKQYFSSIIDEMIESDAMDKLIADRLEYLENQLELEDLRAFECIKAENMDAVEIYNDLEYNNLVDIVINDNKDGSIKQLIDEHIEDEKAFMDSILIDVIQKQDMFQKAIDEMVVKHFEMEYEPQRFDYEHDYWYEQPYRGEYWPSEDESVKDPFDSLGDIDYPEGYVERDFNQECPREYYEYDFDEEDFDTHNENHYIDSQIDIEEKYQNQIENRPKEDTVEYEDVDELRNRKLIAEREKVETLFRDYFTKDDALENIIKQKLKERKFSQ